MKLTISAFLFFSPISIFGFSVSTAVANPNNFKAEYLTFGIFLTFITFIFYLLLSILIEKLTSLIKVTFPLFFLAIVLTGAFRGYIFYSLIDYLQLIQPTDLFSRIIGSIFTTTFWLLVSNILISNSRTFRINYQNALSQFINKNKSLNKSSNVEDQNFEELNLLQVDLKNSVEKYLGDTNSESFMQISNTLIAKINDELKPLSQRVWIRSLGNFPEFRYTKLLKDAFYSLNYSKLNFYLTITILSFFNNLIIRGLLESSLRTISFLTLTFLILSAHHFFKNKVNISKYWENTILLILIGIVPIFGSEFFTRLFGYSSDLVANLLITPITPLIIFLFSLQKLTQSDREFIINSLSNYSSNSTSSRDTTKSTLASFIHNSLQSEFLSLAKRLEAVAYSENKEESAKLIEQVSSLVNRSLSEDFAKFSQTPLERLKKVVDSWKGILDIEFNVKDQLLFDDSKNILIVQIIEEVATNSYRYGKASKLTVSAEKSKGNLVLLLQTNSNSKVVKSRGIGEKWLNQITKSPVNLSKNSIGILVTVEI